MSSELATRRPVEPSPEFEEQEVDFGRHLRRILTHWWLPVLGLVVGIVAGFLVSAGSSRPYQARVIVYLGQPFAPGGSTPIQNLPTKLGFVGQLVLAQATINRVAGQIGVRPSKLRAAVSTEAVPGIAQGRFQQPAPLVEIRARGLPRKKGIAAADALAAVVVKDFSSYVDVKLATYKERLTRASRELVEVNARIADAQQQQAKVLADRSLPEAEKLIVLANYNNVLQFNENRQINLEGTQLTLRELVALAQQVERARVIEPASASRASPPSQRAAAAIGGLIGLLLGILAALLWDPVAARMRARPT